MFFVSLVSALASAAGISFAVNERYHPRRMDEANRVISLYEVEISKGQATAENYAGLVEGLKKRRDAYFNHADASETEGRIYEAYKGMLAADPANYEAGVSVIEYEVEIGKIDGLLEKIEKLASSNPNAYRCHLLKGRILFYLADFEGSILEITRGISLMPADSGYDTAVYKKLLAAAGKFSAIVKKAPKDASGEPATAAALADAAAVLLDRDVARYPKNIDRAIELLKKSVEKDKNYARAYIMLASAVGDHRKNYREAMDWLKKLENVPCENALLKKARNLNQKYFRLSTAATLKKK